MAAIKALTDGALLKLCRAHARAGRFVVAASGIARLERAEMSATDVRSVLGSATVCRRVSAGAWEVTGRLLDGSVGSVMVAFDDETLTVV